MILLYQCDEDGNGRDIIGGGGGGEVLLMASRDTLTNKRVEKMMVQLVKLIESSSRAKKVSVGGGRGGVDPVVDGWVFLQA